MKCFNEMIEMFSNIKTFCRHELVKVYTEGSIFRTFLHFFFCKRSCDGVTDYCFKCSHVRFRNFQNQVLFDDVILTERDFKSKLGLDNRTIDFDVFLSNYLKYRHNEEIGCRRERIIEYEADVYVLFVSTFIRINLNVCYDFFLKLPLTLNDEKLNVNHFFVVFDKFSDLNRSVCYDVSFDKPLKGPYKSLIEKKQYYGQLVVVSTSNLRSNEYFESESESEF